MLFRSFPTVLSRCWTTSHSQLVLLPWTGHLTAWLDPFGQVGEETHRWFDTHLASNDISTAATD